MENEPGFRHRTWLSADGLTLHARDYAAAEGKARLPVICLHGRTRNARDFDVLAPWIAARHRRVLAVDVRGRGLSARDPDASYWLPTYADDVRRLAEALGISRAIFIGTSMGGLIAMELAALAPALIVAAVINDVGPVLAAEGLAPHHRAGDRAIGALPRSARRDLQYRGRQAVHRQRARARGL